MSKNAKDVIKNYLDGIAATDSAFNEAYSNKACEVKTYINMNEYDYSLCNNEECKQKHTCVRYLSYIDAKVDNFRYSVPIFVNVKPTGECNKYVKVNQL